MSAVARTGGLTSLFLYDGRYDAAGWSARLARAGGAQLVDVRSADPAILWRSVLAPRLAGGATRIDGLTPGADHAIAALFARDLGLLQLRPPIEAGELVRWSLERR